MPVVEELALEWGDRLRVLRVDVDEDDVILHSFGASSLPSFVLFRDGEEVDRLISLPGLIRWRLERLVEPHLG